MADLETPLAGLDKTVTQLRASAPPERRCEGCGEVGTWEPGRPCPDCQEKAAASADFDRRRGDWRGSLVACKVPEKYLQVPASLRLPAVLEGWHGQPWSATLLGPTGTGKTWGGVRLLGRLFCGGRPGVFVDAPLALEIMRQEIDSRDEKGKTLRALLSAPVLLLDDISGGRDTDWARDRWVILLRHRYNHQLPTILTSNKANLLELAEGCLDAAIGSRLAAGVVYPFKGKDRRIQGAT